MKWIGYIVSCVALACHAEYEAFVVVPVADLVDYGQAIKGPHGHRRPPCLVMSHFANGSKAARLGQLLFNERVQVVEHRGELAKVIVANQFYKDSASGQLRNDFWVAKSSIEQLTHRVRHALPTENESFVTLQDPWQVPDLGITLSVGTRLRVIKEDPHGITVHLYHRRRHQIVTAVVPHEACLTLATTRRQSMVALARRIADAPGKTPYVWGGSSSCLRYIEPQFEMAPSGCPQGDAFAVVGSPRPAVFSGYDCSGFIMRMAQIVGIPLYPKNSLTLKEVLGVLPPDQKPQEGDVIFMPGHVVLISDVSKNLVIEARTQEHGYGYVHEAPIQDLFEGVETIAQLHEYAGKLLKRLDKNGECIARVPVFILPLVGRAGEFDIADMPV